MNLKRYYILFLAFFSSILLGQVSFNAIPNKTVVKLGENIAINFVITLKERANIEGIEYPSFNNFKVMGRTRSHQLSITNGDKTIQDIETIILRPEKKGRIKIGKAQVKIDDTTYETKELFIEVTEASKANVKKGENRYIFLNVELSENTTYVNEPIYATVKLYAKSYDALKKRTEIEVPDLSNFQVHPIGEKSDFRDIAQEVYNNQVYVSEVVGKYVLIPQKTGDLEIPLFYLRVAVPIDFFDEKIIELNTAPHEVKVKRLPRNAPKSFHGAIGDFTFKTYLNKNNLEKNRAFKVNMELSGEGNLSYIQMPPLELNTDLEVYKPKRNIIVDDTDFPPTGKIIETYTIVPQYGGAYEIPAIEFTYFNPEQEKYITITSQKVDLNIKGAKKEVEKVNSTPIDSAKSKTEETKIVEEKADNILDSVVFQSKGINKNIKKIENKGEQIIKKGKKYFNWF